MLKTLARDIITHPQEWSRKEDYLERSITSAAYGQGTARIKIFDVKKYSVWVAGSWYPVTWNSRRLLTKAKKAWLEFHFDQVKNTWQQNGMTTEEWLLWRQSQLDKK